MNNITVRELHRHSEELNVDVYVPDKITGADKLRIKMEAVKLNLRYGSKLHVHIFDENPRKE